MAIGPIGSMIYTNQQVPFVSTTVGDFNARFEIQNIMAQHIVNEEEKKVQEVREPEENREIDPDREHRRQEEETEEKNREEAAEHKEKEDTTSPPLYHLDIRI